MANSTKREREFLFTWRIENYSYYPAEISTCITSPEFITQNLYNCRWYLKLYPRGNGDEDFIACYLHRCDDNNTVPSISVNFKLGLLGDNETFAEKKLEGKAILKGDFIGEDEFMPISKLNRMMKNFSEDVLVVQCYINTNNSARTIPLQFFFTSCEAKTRIGFDECSVLKNVFYPMCISPEKHRFVLSGIMHSEINLCIQNNEFEVSFQIWNDSKNLPHLVKCQLFVFDNTGTKIISKTARNLLSALFQTWDFTIIFTTETLLASDSSNEFLLKLVVSYSNDLDNSKIIKYSRNQSLEKNKSVNSLCELQRNMHDMFNNKKHCDVKIRVDNKTLTAHKCVLSSRSPVFSAMFDNDMLENLTGEVNIQDIDAETINSFLKFIYTGLLEEMDYGKAHSLFIAADKYQILSLREECSTFLKSILSFENVCQIISLSDLVQDEDLKEFALNYVRENSEKILPTSYWSNWIQKNPKLASESLMCLSLELEPIMK